MASQIQHQPGPKTHVALFHQFLTRDETKWLPLYCRTPNHFKTQGENFRRRLKVAIQPGPNQCDCRVNDVIGYAVTNMCAALISIHDKNERACKEGRLRFQDVGPWQLNILEYHLFNEARGCLQGMADFIGSEGLTQCSAFGIRRVWDQRFNRAREEVCHRIETELDKRHPLPQGASGQASGQAS